MCGRFGYTKSREIPKRFKRKFSDKFDFKDRYNISPTQIVPVVTSNCIELMRWGLIPHWSHDEKIGYSMINARYESVSEKPTYKKSFKFQRVIIPSSLFYEWDKSKKPSQPWLFKLKNNELFGFAGIYNSWINPKTKDEIKTFSIITVPANRIVGKIHERMPAILKKKDEEEWLNPDNIEKNQLIPFLNPYPDSEMESYPVSTILNKPISDNASLIRPINL